jgi:hypothetical protein
MNNSKVFLTKQFLLCILFFASIGTASAQLSWQNKNAGTSQAVIGGKENGQNLQVCRCNYNGAKHPGKVVAGKCHIGWGGKEVFLPDYEVLINSGNADIQWQKMNGSQIPQNGVEAGRERNTVYYVGRATHTDGSIHPGKVFMAGGQYICNYSWGGKEIVVRSNFEVLVSNGSAAFTPKSGGIYNIESKSSAGRYLDIYGGAANVGANIGLWNLNTTAGTPNQRFRLQDAGGGYFYLVSPLNPMAVITTVGAGTQQGTNVSLSIFMPVNGNQKFKFVNAGNGYVKIVSAVNNNYFLSVADDNANIVLRSGNHGDKSLFKMTEPEAMNFKIKDLNCIETLDYGEDELVINLWIDGVLQKIPSKDWKVMNEESDIEQWNLNRSFKFYNTVKMQLKEVDSEVIGTIDLNRNSPQGDQIKSLTGTEDSHYIVRFVLGDNEILPTVFFNDEFIFGAYMHAAKYGGNSVDNVFSEQKKAFKELEDYIKQHDQSSIPPVPAPDLGPEAEIVLTSTLTGIITGFAESGPVGWAIGGTILAVSSAVFFPAYFAGQNGVLELQVANLSNQKLEIESFEMSSGKKVSGPDKGNVIPAKMGKDKNPVSFFSFRKKWGWTGIVGKIKFKPTPEMPRGMIVEFSTPFVGTNTCQVNIPSYNNASNAGKSSWNGQMRAHIGMDSRNDFFPKIIVTLENATK